MNLVAQENEQTGDVEMVSRRKEKNAAGERGRGSFSYVSGGHGGQASGVGICQGTSRPRPKVSRSGPPRQHGLTAVAQVRRSFFAGLGGWEGAGVAGQQMEAQKKHKPPIPLRFRICRGHSHADNRR